MSDSVTLIEIVCLAIFYQIESSKEHLEAVQKQIKSVQTELSQVTIPTGPFLAAVFWMSRNALGERCVTSKKRLRGRLF